MNSAFLTRRTAGVMFALALGATAACATPLEKAATADEPPAAAASAPAACEPGPATEEKVTVRNAYGTLEGTLVVPEGCGPHPVALIIAGSGPTDRDGNAPKMYRLLAKELASRGVASLRYDKAGVGASAKAFTSKAEDFTFEMGVADAALFASALRADARFSRLTIAGHSEGSLIGMLVAKTVTIDGFVSMAGAGRRIGVVLREQLARNIRDAALLARAREIIASLERGERVTDVPQELANLFHPSVQGYFIAWMKYDPAEVLRDAALGGVLVAQGTTDIQVSLEDANRLVSARSDAKLLAVENMNHALKEATGTTASEQADAYSDPSLPIVTELAEGVASFARGS